MPEASIGHLFGANKTYTTDVTDTEKVMGFSLLISPGVYYYITPKLALEAKFGWFGFRNEVAKPGNDVKDIQNTFGVKFPPDSFCFRIDIYPVGRINCKKNYLWAGLCRVNAVFLMFETELSYHHFLSVGFFTCKTNSYQVNALFKFVSSRSTVFVLG